MRRSIAPSGRGRAAWRRRAGPTRARSCARRAPRRGRRGAGPRSGAAGRSCRSAPRRRHRRTRRRAGSWRSSAGATRPPARRAGARAGRDRRRSPSPKTATCEPLVARWAAANGSSRPERIASVTTSAVAAAKIARAVRAVCIGRPARSARATRRAASIAFRPPAASAARRSRPCPRPSSSRVSWAIWPSRMAMTRSARAATRASWVTSTIVWSRSSCIPRRSAITSRALAVSRLPVGSSASSTRGRLISARAIATRCCWPPESFVGELSAYSAMPSVVEQVGPAGARLARRDAGEQRRQLDVVGHRQVPDQVEELEHEADLAPAHVRPLGLGVPVDAAAAELDLAGRRPVQPAEQVQQRRLPAAARPGDGDELALRHRRVDAAQRVHAAFVGPA